MRTCVLLTSDRVAAPNRVPNVTDYRYNWAWGLCNDKIIAYCYLIIGLGNSLEPHFVAYEFYVI